MFYIILIFILSFGVAVIAIQNSMPVQLSFFIWSFDSNLIVVVILSVIAGLLIALLWNLKLRTKYFLRTRKLQNSIALLTKENEVLKGKINEAEKQPAAAVPKEKDNT